MASAAVNGLTLFRMLKYQEMIGFSANQVINEMPVWFLDLLSLLYHSTVGKKAY